MEWVPATEFAAMVRRLADGCRELGLDVPAFRSPPRVAGRCRTIRRLRDGAVVAIALRGRVAADVAADMVEGVVVANRLAGADAARARTHLGPLVAPVDVDLTVADPAGRNLGPRARVAERQTQAA